MHMNMEVLYPPWMPIIFRTTFIAQANYQVNQREHSQKDISEDREFLFLQNMTPLCSKKILVKH